MLKKDAYIFNSMNEKCIQFKVQNNSKEPIIVKTRKKKRRSIKNVPKEKINNKQNNKNIFKKILI